MNEKSVEYLIPGREDAAGCLTDSSRAENNTNDMFVKRTALRRYPPTRARPAKRRACPRVPIFILSTCK